MKRLQNLAVSMIAVIFSFSAYGQGTFQNLNFESVNILPPAQIGFYPFSSVFPNWTGYYGTNQAPQTFYNGISGGAALCSIISRYTAYVSNSVISGNFTAVLSAGQDQIINGSQEIVSAAIAQSGLIPVPAQSLRFSINVPNIGLLVTFNGQELPLYALSTGSNYTVYGADISAFAGLPGELRFTERPLTGPFGTAIFDNIFFSNQPVPEPSTFCLFALGVLLLGWRFLPELTTPQRRTAAIRPHTSKLYHYR